MLLKDLLKLNNYIHLSDGQYSDQGGGGYPGNYATSLVTRYFNRGMCFNKYYHSCDMNYNVVYINEISKTVTITNAESDYQVVS